MRRVAWAMLIAACGASPSPPPRTSSVEMCDVYGACVPCETGDEHAPRCQLLLGEFGSTVLPTDSTIRASPSVAVQPFGPRDRTDRTAPSTAAELASAETIYTELEATPLGATTAGTTTQSELDTIIAQIRAAAVVAQRVVAASEQAAVTTPAVRVEARVLAGDAYDLLGARIATMPIALPANLAGQIATASSVTQAQIAQQFAARVREALVTQVAPVHCLAVARYRDAVTIDPTQARASDQLRRYGDEFVAYCTRERATR